MFIFKWRFRFRSKWLIIETILHYFIISKVTTLVFDIWEFHFSIPYPDNL